MYDYTELKKLHWSEKALANILVWSAIITSVIWGGYVLSIMWGWFVVPFGIPAIATSHAIGLSMIVAFFGRNTAKTSSGIDMDKVSGLWGRIWEAIFIQLFMPLLFLGGAWIVHKFMPVAQVMAEATK